MMDFIATPDDQLSTSFFLAEAWLNGAFPSVTYQQITRTDEYPVTEEQPNKTYTTVGVFPAKIVTTPQREIQSMQGVQYEEGELLVMVPLYFLQSITVSLSPTSATTLDQVMHTDDVLLLPGFLDASNRQQVYIIKKIQKTMWYASTAMVIYFTCAAQAGNARS